VIPERWLVLRLLSATAQDNPKCLTIFGNSPRVHKRVKQEFQVKHVINPEINNQNFWTVNIFIGVQADNPQHGGRLRGQKQNGNQKEIDNDKLTLHTRLPVILSFLLHVAVFSKTLRSGHFFLESNVQGDVKDYDQIYQGDGVKRVINFFAGYLWGHPFLEIY